MKNIVILLLLSQSLLCYAVHGSETGNQWKLDFSVPDIPAMKALGVENSGILRPTTPNELGIQLSRFFNGSEFELPSAFAMEIAPLMFMKSMNIDSYSPSSLENIRISFASFKDEQSGSADFSFGLRYTYDFGFERDISDILEVKSRQILSYKDDYARSKGMGTPELVSNPLENEKAEEYAYKKFKDSLDIELKEKYWNKSKLDFAASSVFNSEPTPSTGTNFRAFNFWFTYAQAIGSWGQFLAGVNTGFVDGIVKSDQFFYSIGARLYAGQNNIKAFAELNYEHNEIKAIINSFLINCGAELNLTENTWIVYNFGFVSDLDYAVSEFKTNLDFKYNISEILNLVSK